RDLLRRISLAIGKSKKVVVVSGAGISCSSGIPDFRTSGGLFNSLKKRFGTSGEDLFNVSVFNTPLTCQAFHTFMGELKVMIDEAQPTRTHRFIKMLEVTGILLRSYTQNIDGLERRAGLLEALSEEGLRVTAKNVQLHGSMRGLQCILCAAKFPWTADDLAYAQKGDARKCPACLKNCKSAFNRLTRSRGTSIGFLRPTVVLYDEQHPLGDEIAKIQKRDLRARPDFLIVIGTSLKVPGLVDLVKNFSNQVNRRENVIFVNKTPALKKWSNFFGYHICGDTDAWVEMVEAD
ncbi:DHS-like NAD/FAD-binding domain-containing protein, partial [Pluteus cervinus]